MKTRVLLTAAALALAAIAGNAQQTASDGANSRWGSRSPISPVRSAPRALAAARAEIGHLDEIEAKLIAAKDKYWAGQTRIQKDAVAADLS